MPAFETSTRATLAQLAARIAALEPIDNTIHFNVGQIKTPYLGVEGTPTPAALAVFGRLNIPSPRSISVVHIHQEVAGSGGNTVFELYRHRSGVFALLTTITLTHTAGDIATAADVPTGALAELEAGDYLFAQALELQSGPADGYTFDVHFKPAATL